MKTSYTTISFFAFVVVVRNEDISLLLWPNGLETNLSYFIALHPLIVDDCNKTRTVSRRGPYIQLFP